MSSGGRGVSTLLGFLAGAVVGAGLALLFAPQSGKETRQKIKETSEKMAGDIKQNYEKVSKEVKHAAESGFDHVKSFVGGSKHAAEKKD